MYSLGDSFKIVGGFKLWTAQYFCMHSLASLMTYYNALCRSISPVELGLAKEGEEAYLRGSYLRRPMFFCL